MTTRSELLQQIKATKAAIQPQYQAKLAALKSVRDARAALVPARTALATARDAFQAAGDAERAARKAHADARDSLAAFDGGVR